MNSQMVNWASGALFNFVHSNNLIYNTCWEDPRLDRQAMKLTSDDTVLVITSAGCNALDYALDAPERIFAVDMNLRQNALLELKMAGIRALTYEEFFDLFGRGRLAGFTEIYRKRLRPHLSEVSQRHWDEKRNYFTSRKKSESFYYRGTAGLFARLCKYYFGARDLHEYINLLFSAPSVLRQREIYYGFLHSKVWTPFMKWCMSWDATLSLLGVPRPQRLQIERDYPGGISKFMQDCVESVFTKLPTKDNYFWWLYFNGEYTEDRCPQYLTREGFDKLKGGLVDSISVHTSSLHHFLQNTKAKISRYVLLDHMDWLAQSKTDLLRAEWETFLGSARSGARFLWRSGGLSVDFVDPLLVRYQGRQQRVGDLLSYDTELARTLHAQDRVHTYGSFCIANLN